jgi:hypothetical protein
MAKKIKGWAKLKKEWCGSSVLQSADFALFQDSKEHERVTMVVTDERVFTESEVKAMLDEIHGLAQAYWDNAGHGAPDMLSASEVAGIAERGGIVLDPA